MEKNFKLTQKKAEKLQDEIYRRMSAEKKLKIAFEFFKFGKKLDSLKIKTK
jgi:hypothetical protein